MDARLTEHEREVNGCSGCARACGSSAESEVPTLMPVKAGRTLDVRTDEHAIARPTLHRMDVAAVVVALGGRAARRRVGRATHAPARRRRLDAERLRADEALDAAREGIGRGHDRSAIRSWARCRTASCCSTEDGERCSRTRAIERHLGTRPEPSSRSSLPVSARPSGASPRPSASRSRRSRPVHRRAGSGSRQRPPGPTGRCWP